jgi:hypothetical protein
MNRTIRGRHARKETVAMKPYALSLLCATLAGLAWATDAPPPECAPKVCVPVPAVKKTEKVIYDERCVDYCLPHCSLWSFFGCGCDAGGCLNCGSPRTRRVLIKKVVHEECPDVKCEVREQLPCAK